VVGYVLDARAPFACFNPAFDTIIKDLPCVFILNKCDLADDTKTAEWISYFKSIGMDALAVSTDKHSSVNLIKTAFANAPKKSLERLKAKGVYRAIRAMIVGVPNCGKSTIINSLSGKKSALVGDKPGITKGKQWIRLTEGLELLDTPGTLWSKFEDQNIAQNLLFVGSISDNIIDKNEAAQLLIAKLAALYPSFLAKRFKLELNTLKNSPTSVLEEIAKKRGCLIKGQPDVLRAAVIVLDEFKKGKIGKITLETPSDYGK
jgi:ribosome biogenesis GTPase A